MALRNDNAGEMTARTVHRGAFCFLVLFCGQVSFAFPLFCLKVVEKWVSDMELTFLVRVITAVVLPIHPPTQPSLSSTKTLAGASLKATAGANPNTG